MPEIPLQLPLCQDISNSDEIAFVKLGMTEIIRSHSLVSMPRIELEKADELRVNEFEIKFVAFKPPLYLPQG